MSLKNLKLHWKPNQYLVAPKGYTESDPHLESPAYATSPDALKAAFIKVIEGEERTKISSQNGLFIEASQSTALLRFKDLISVEFLPEGEGESRIVIYSRSILGIRDFGVNKKRITAWLAKLHQAVPPKG